MKSSRSAVAVAICAGTLLGGLSASVIVPALGGDSPRASSAAAAPAAEERIPAARPSAQPAASTERHPARTASAAAPPLAGSAPAASAVAVDGTDPVELEGPPPSWLVADVPTTAGEVRAAALRCARGDAGECMRVGDAYEAGHGIPPDPRQARLNRSQGARLFEQACRRRNADACYSLSVLHTLGRGVIANPATADAYRGLARDICRTAPAPICDRLRHTGSE